MLIHPSFLSNRSSRRILLSGIGVSAVLAFVAALWLSRSAIDSAREHAPVAHAERTHPPWVYGRTDARFTIMEYADLECPYCRAYFSVLQQWIKDHPEVNWQWHHLPLATHEPAATQAAHLAECVGESKGNDAFWNTIDWIYKHNRGSGAGLPADATVQACLGTGRLLARIQAQAAAAAREGITATPTLRLTDRETGKTLTLQGPIEGDALLSAIDLLTSTNDSSPGAR